MKTNKSFWAVIIIFCALIIISASALALFQTQTRTQTQIQRPVACQNDSDCKLIYSSCDCAAVPNTDLRKRLPSDKLCDLNRCTKDVTAQCKSGKCLVRDNVYPQQNEASSSDKFYCEKDSDCVVSAGSSCCGSCNTIVVNINEEQRLKGLREQDCQKIQYQCPGRACAPPPITPVCQDNFCVAIGKGQDETFWERGTKQIIRWQVISSLPNINISLMPLPGPPCTKDPCPLAPVFNYPIASRAANTGSLTWVVGQIEGGTYVPDGAYVIQIGSDKSDQPFSLFTTQSKTPTINLTSPQGGETWVIGTQQSIQWQAPTSVTKVTIKTYYGDATPTCNKYKTVCKISSSIPSIIVKDTPNDGEYLWTVGETETMDPSYFQPNENYYIVVEDAVFNVSGQNETPLIIAVAFY